MAAKVSLLALLACHLHRMIVGIPNTKSERAIVETIFEIAATKSGMNVVTEKL